MTASDALTGRNRDDRDLSVLCAVGLHSSFQVSHPEEG
jgi:hypothetical protein